MIEITLDDKPGRFRETVLEDARKNPANLTMKLGDAFPKEPMVPPNPCCKQENNQ